MSVFERVEISIPKYIPVSIFFDTGKILMFFSWKKIMKKVKKLKKNFLEKV
jgi:hypothetical protein